MDEEFKQAIESINGRLDAFEGTLEDYHKLLTNHMTDFTTKFGRLKVSVESSIENSKERDKALQVKIDSYKWGLLLVASFTVISLGGFVAVALWALSQLMTR